VTPARRSRELARNASGCTITETGRDEVGAWLAEPILAEPNLQADLLVKVMLSLMLGRPAEEYLDVQRAAHLQRMHELTKLNRSNSAKAS
jgi:hypothetical protein